MPTLTYRQYLSLLPIGQGIVNTLEIKHPNLTTTRKCDYTDSPFVAIDENGVSRTYTPAMMKVQVDLVDLTTQHELIISTHAYTGETYDLIESLSAEAAITPVAITHRIYLFDYPGVPAANPATYYPYKSVAKQSGAKIACHQPDLGSMPAVELYSIERFPNLAETDFT